MSEEAQLDNEFIDLEVERIEIMFLENNYDLKRKKIYLKLKVDEAKKTNNYNLLKVCDIILDKINN